MVLLTPISSKLSPTKAFTRRLGESAACRASWPTLKPTPAMPTPITTQATHMAHTGSRPLMISA